MQLNIRHRTNFINTINICIGCGFVSLVLSWGQRLRHRDSWDTWYDTFIRNGGDRIVWCGNGNVGTQLIIITQTETSQGQARIRPGIINMPTESSSWESANGVPSITSQFAHFAP